MVTSNNNMKQSMTSINITNKRVKVTLACAVCRKKKVKCDGIQPTCSRCNNMGFDCHYSDPPKKRGPPKGQVEIIESRAHRIESLRVAGNTPTTKNHSDHKIPINSVVHHPVTNNHNDNNNQHLHPYNKKNDIGLPLSSKPTTIYSKNTIMCLLSGAVDTIHSNKRNLCSSNTPGSQYTWSDFYMKDNDYKVNQYHQWAMNYFNYFNLFFPILSKPHFMRQLFNHDMDHLLLYAVCTIGSQYVNTNNNDDDKDEDDKKHKNNNSSQFYFEKCLVILNTSHDTTTTLATVQALVILCWYSYLLGNMQTCYELRQRLVKTVNDLQLYRDPESSLGIFMIEMRRRAFWVSFVIDQWLSCCTDERYFILQDGWNCQYPQLEDSQLLVIDSKQWKSIQQPSSTYLMENKNQHDISDLSAEYALQITAFSEMIKLARIVSDMHDLYLSSSTSESSSLILHQHQPIIISHLTDWLLRLPPYLEYGKPMDDSPPSPIARIYHIFYYTLQIMLYQPFLSNNKNSHSTHHQQQLIDNNMARTICTNAANTIIHIAEQMIHHQQHLYLKNTFMISFTFAVSIHLDNTIQLDQRRNSISSLLCLDKSVCVLKKSNCSLLSAEEFDQLIDRFLLDHYGIQFNDDENDNNDNNNDNNNFDHKNNINDNIHSQLHYQQQQQLTMKLDLKRNIDTIADNESSSSSSSSSIISFDNNNDHPSKRIMYIKNNENKEINNTQLTLSNHQYKDNILDTELESLLNATTATSSSSSTSPTISFSLNTWLDDHDTNNNNTNTNNSNHYVPTSASSSFWIPTSNLNSPIDSLSSPPLISSDDSSLYSPTLSNDYHNYDFSHFHHPRSTSMINHYSNSNNNSNNDNNSNMNIFSSFTNHLYNNTQLLSTSSISTTLTPSNDYYYLLNDDKNLKLSSPTTSSSFILPTNEYYDFISDTLINNITNQNY